MMATKKKRSSQDSSTMTMQELTNFNKAKKKKKSPLAALSNEDIALLKQIFGDTLDLDDDLAVRSAVGDSVTSEQIRLVADDLLGPGAEAIPTGEAALGPEDQLRLALAREDVPGPAPAGDPLVFPEVVTKAPRPGSEQENDGGVLNKLNDFRQSMIAQQRTSGRGVDTDLLTRDDLDRALQGLKDSFLGNAIRSRFGGQAFNRPTDRPFENEDGVLQARMQLTEAPRPNLASTFGPQQAQARPTQKPRQRGTAGPQQTQLGPTLEPGQLSQLGPLQRLTSRDPGVSDPRRIPKRDPGISDPRRIPKRGSGLTQAVGQSGLPDTLSVGGPLPTREPISETDVAAGGGSNTLANILKFGGVAALGALLANRSGGKGGRSAAPAGRGKFGSLERGQSLTVPRSKTGTERLFSALPAATNAFMNVRLQQQAREDALGQATAKAEAAQAKQRVDLGSLLIKEGLGKDGLNLIATVDPTILDTIDINNLPETGTLNTSDRLLSPEVFKNLTSEAKAAALTQFAEEKGINLPLGNLIRDDDNALSDSFLFKLAEMGIVLDTNSAVPREAFEQIAEFTAAQRRTESTQQRITNLKNTIGAINTATLIDTNFEDDGKAMIAQLTEELANLTGELTGGTQQVPAPDTSTPEGQQEIAAEIRNRRDQFKDMTPEELELALQNSKIDTSSPTIQEAIREVTGG